MLISTMLAAGEALPTTGFPGAILDLDHGAIIPCLFYSLRFPTSAYLLLWLMFFAWQLVQCVEMQALGSVKEGFKLAIGRASFVNDFACIARKR
jgi:hypothetical protein